jgi:hypothetical protein
MARSWRRRMRRGVMWAIVVLLLSGSTLRSEGPSGLGAMPRVRSSDATITSAIAVAESRSETFRSLVRAIEGTDGIVYVERGRCGHHVPACLTLSIVSGPGYRLLRVLVDNRFSFVSLMATIGHELRHALEVLSEPGVRTLTAAYMFYMREVPTANEAFETAAAIRAGAAVASELSRR